MRRASDQAAALKRESKSAPVKRNAADQLAALRKIRLSLDVTPEMKRVLDSLALNTGSTQADVLRRAVALYAAVRAAQETGEGEPAIAKDGKVVVKLVGV